MIDRLPFTYRLSWTEFGMHYYGSKFSKGCHPDDLWKTYFTSSKYVKEFIKTYGNPDIIKVTRTFDTIAECTSWESKFLTKFKANKNPNFINRSLGFGDHHNYKDGFSKQETQDKVDKTLKTKYGARGSASSIIKSSVEKTNLKRYGETHTLKLDKVREAREKANLEKYGHINPFASKLFYKLHENPMHNPKHRQAHKEIMQLKNWKSRDERTSKVWEEKYGVKHYYQSQEFRDKMELLKKPCPYGCRDNHKYDKGNFTNHMVKCHQWTKEQVKEYHA